MTECETPLCNNSINDDEQQLIKLCLKKPQKWNWELSTSKSSSNILFPTIQLFDEDNETLLVETSEANFSAGSKLRKSASVSKAGGSVMRKKTDSSLAAVGDVRRTNFEGIKSPITVVETTESDAASCKHDPNPPDDTSKESQRQQKIYSRSSSCRSRSSILKRIREFSELNHESSDDDECVATARGVKNGPDSNKAAASKEAEKLKKYSMRTCNIGTILVPTQESLLSQDSPAPRRRRRGSYPNATGE
jgi:hypothetical protein